MVLVKSSNQRPPSTLVFQLVAGEFLHGLICFGTPDENDWIIDDDPTGDIVSSRTWLLLSFFKTIVFFVFRSDPLRCDAIPWMDGWMDGLVTGDRIVLKVEC